MLHIVCLNPKFTFSDSLLEPWKIYIDINMTVKGDHMENYLRPYLDFQQKQHTDFNGDDTMKASKTLTGHGNWYDEKSSLNSTTYITC